MYVSRKLPGKTNVSEQNKRAKVIYSYPPANDKELRLEVGNIIEILKQENEGWWKGNLNGKIGMFPSNFVEVIEKEKEKQRPGHTVLGEESHDDIIRRNRIRWETSIDPNTISQPLIASSILTDDEVKKFNMGINQDRMNYLLSVLRQKSRTEYEKFIRVLKDNGYEDLIPGETRLKSFKGLMKRIIPSSENMAYASQLEDAEHSGSKFQLPELQSSTDYQVYDYQSTDRFDEKEEKDTQPPDELKEIAEIIENVQDLMGNQDISEIPIVRSALYEAYKLIITLDRLTTRIAFGDFLAQKKFAALAKEYLIFLAKHNLNERYKLWCWDNLLGILTNLSAKSVKFATALGQSGVIEWLLSLMRNEFYKDIREENYDAVEEVTSVLFNCAKITDNRHIYETLDFWDIGIHFIRKSRHLLSSFAITRAISQVYDSKKVAKLDVPSNIIIEVLKYVQLAMKEDNHVYDYWPVDALISGIGHLIVNHNNREVAVQNGLVSVLIQVTSTGSEIEQEWALYVLWKLVSTELSEEIRARRHDLLAVLNDCLKSPCEGVRNNAMCALSQLQGNVGQATSRVITDCKYKNVCLQYIKHTLDIDDAFIDEEKSVCYCIDCHSTRGDQPTYLRGSPRKSYGLPIGWFRFGLKPPHRAFSKSVKAFENWHRAYHGTNPRVVNDILKVGDLLMPGDQAIDDINLKPRPGHYTDDWKPEGFNIKQVFLSPSIRYAGLDAYASPNHYVDKNSGKGYRVKVALQVLIHPGTYKVGPETVGATRKDWQIDPNFENRELEWSTRKRGSTIIYGVLVKMDKER